MDFTNQLQFNKPKISASSLKTYNSLLRTIYTNVFGKDDTPDVDKFKMHEKVLEYLKNEPIEQKIFIIGGREIYKESFKETRVRVKLPAINFEKMHKLLKRIGIATTPA